MVFQLMRWIDHHKKPIYPVESSPHTAFYNTDKGQLMIGTDKLENIKNLQDFPLYLQLKAKIITLKEREHGISLSYEEGGFVHDPVLLYPESMDNYYTSEIEIHYLGMGEYRDPHDHQIHTFLGQQLPWGTLCFEGTLLYRLPFITQESSLNIKSEEGVQDVRGYGGYYRLGCALEEVQQIFFTSGFEGNCSYFYLSTLSDWHHKGIQPPIPASQEGHQIRFINGGEEPIENLRSALQKGGARLSLYGGVDDHEAEIIGHYQSIDGQGTSHDQLILTYVRRES